MIEESIAKNLSGLPYKRIIDVRLNMRVSDDVLREIALELKSKETQQFEYTRITFFLPGKGPGKGPGNTGGWALADFDSGLRVTIMGFTIEEERTYRTAPLELPTGGEPLGTWMIEDGFLKSRITIYRRDGRWYYHLQWTGTKEPGAIEMDELPTQSGHVLKRRGSSDRYVVGARGDLEIHNADGKLISRPTPVVPPPPVR